MPSIPHLRHPLRERLNGMRGYIERRFDIPVGLEELEQPVKPYIGTEEATR